MATTRRAWSWLGTASSVRLISVGMAVYALVIGLLVFGYANVSNCLATYADKSANSTAARAKIASEDRELDARDRVARDKAETALDRALMAIVQQPQDRAETTAAFTELVKVRSAAAATRTETNRQRALNEAERKKSPPPPPPSQTC